MPNVKRPDAEFQSLSTSGIEHSPLTLALFNKG